MAIKDLQPRQGKVDIVVEVIDKGEIREFQKFGRSGRVCSAKVKDETGEIKLTLWNDQIDQVNVGDKLQISNGYVNEFQGEMQLTTGKFGKLEVVGKAEEKEEKKAEKKEAAKGQEQQAQQAAEETKKSEKAKKPEETKEEPDVEEVSVEEENIE
jgi:replication factor A1